MDATTIVLPAAPQQSRRQRLPLLAALVPVVAGGVLWLVTGSLFALCFAAMGPLMLLTSYLDGIRTRKKDRRLAETETDAAWDRAEAECERLHLQEHAVLWRRDPDVVQCLREPPLKGGAELNARTRVVIGRGSVRSRVQASGGDDDRSRAFRERAQQLPDAPMTVQLGGGICVRAPRPVAESVVRALVVQLCLRFSAAQLSVVGDDVDACGLSALPHALRRRAGFALAIGDAADGADARIAIRMPGEEPPDGVTTMLDCTVPTLGQARIAEGTVLAVSVEALSRRQAEHIGTRLHGGTDVETAVPDALGLSELTPREPTGSAGGLGATFGRGERGDLSIDLVEDGPHAIVTGMTGTGKSELLISWVAGIAASHSPAEVSFVLIDFKGGTAFEPLRALPHVVAVVTDLDADGARRGVGSLTAELRRRESVLTECGARDVRDCPQLGRLIVVVDEFAAMLQEHPDLGQVFTDVAARGRALGMHLILGTQRASGIIRDALAANCPLRMSLRVAEPADSRFVIGSDVAAQLPGGPEARGLAYVRRPRDAEAHTARIALTAPADLTALASRWPGVEPPASPWLPPLPTIVPIPEPAPLQTDEIAVLGLADDPERQRQPWVTLRRGEGLAILGGPDAGKSAALTMLAAQLPDAVVVPSDPEQAWDAVAELASGRHGPVLCDDLDVLFGAYPAEYAQLFLSRWESIVRSSASTVITLSRVSGPLGRIVDGLSRRALLRFGGKVEHISAGGEPGSYSRTRPDGRACIDEQEVQLCWTDRDPIARAPAFEPEAWGATREITGVITGAAEATAAMLAASHPGFEVLSLEAALTQSQNPDAAERSQPRRRIIVGDPEEWRARWTHLQTIRTTGEMLVAVECATELRQLVGARDLPPYAMAHADRAWAVTAGGRPRRVLLA